MRLTLATLALPLLLNSCLLPDLGARVHAGYMSLQPTGNVALQDAAASNSSNSVRNDLDGGFNFDDQGTPLLKAEVNLGNWDLVASGFVFEEETRSILANDFGDIAAGSNVTTDFDVRNLQGALLYNLIDLEVVDLSAGVCVNYFDVDMQVTSTTPATESLAFDTPVPMLYGRVTAGVGIVSAAVGVGWMDVDLGDTDGSFFDLDAMVTVQPFPFLELMGGYRNILIDATGESNRQGFDNHLRLSGFYLGGGLTF